MNLRWHDREMNVEDARHEEAIARRVAMIEEVRKAELVRDRLQSLDRITRAYPEGHEMRVLLEDLRLDRTLGVVEEHVRTLRDTLLHPRGT